MRLLKHADLGVLCVDDAARSQARGAVASAPSVALDRPKDLWHDHAAPRENPRLAAPRSRERARPSVGDASIASPPLKRHDGGPDARAERCPERPTQCMALYTLEIAPNSRSGS
jgi:hypothetical protein